MSAILDALKKSEQERKLGESPDLQSIHHGMVVPGDKRSSPMLGLVVLILLLSLMLVAWLLWVNRSGFDYAFTDIEAIPADTAPGKAVSEPTGADSTSAPAATKPAQAAPAQPSRQVSSKRPEEAASPEPPVAKTKQQRVAVPLWELPDHRRRALPAMTYSFHVYSDNPEDRTIIINGRRMREGGRVATGLRLEEITEQGVVLDFEGDLIYVPVVDGW